MKCFPGSETQFVGNTITNNCSVVMSRQMTVDVVCSGSRKTVAYIDVASQDEGQMTMREWAEYFSSPHRPRVLNVLSLELTGTRCVFRQSMFVCQQRTEFVTSNSSFLV